MIPDSETSCGSAVSVTAADVINSAVNRLFKSATDLIQADPHQWSDRPCATCQAVTTIIGYNFGCVRKARGK